MARDCLMCSRNDDPTTYERDTTMTQNISAEEIAREADKYNGWTNRETWNTHLWMTNDEGTYYTARQIVRERFESDMDYPAVGAADALRDWWDEAFGPEDTSGPVQDAWSYAIARTDWRRIVEALTEE